MKLGYYPGCSLHRTGREYQESLKEILPLLDIELAEIRDWSCCGASSGHATNHLLAIALSARNLALAEEQGLEKVMAPCAACYSRLSTAHHELAEDPQLAAKVDRIIRRPFRNQVPVLSIVELLRDLAPKLKDAVKKPLTGTKIACYYGCLLVRPEKVTGFDDPEQPTSLETIITALGATPVQWDRRLDCCGAGFSMSRTGSVIRLSRLILEDAKAAGAEAVAVACPMCHSNLDMRQEAMAHGEPLNLPILFISELVGLALGLDPQQLGLQRHFVATAPFIARAQEPRQLPPAKAAKPAQPEAEG